METSGSVVRSPSGCPVPVRTVRRDHPVLHLRDSDQSIDLRVRKERTNHHHIEDYDFCGAFHIHKELFLVPNLATFALFRNPTRARKDLVGMDGQRKVGHTHHVKESANVEVGSRLHSLFFLYPRMRHKNGDTLISYGLIPR